MKAACSFFGKCSGCSLQQFPYVKQLRDKTKYVRETLGRLVPKGEAVEAVIRPIVPSPAEFGYRTSSKLCLNEDETGRRSIGLYARGTKKVVDIPGCPIHHPAINKLIQRLFAPSQPTPATFYQHGRRAFQTGRLKFLTVRYSPESDRFGVIISHTGVPRADLEAWAQRFHLSTNISFYESLLSRVDEDLVISRDVKYLAGDPVFTYQLDGRRYQLDPMAFFQANSSLVKGFIDHIVEGLEGPELLDLYGGFGSYSMAAASAFGKIHLVEANPHATEAAHKTAVEGKLGHIQCTAASVEDILKRLLRSGADKVSHMIVNPPRSGLSRQVVESLSSPGWNGLKKLHYVSCNMATLQRDLQHLLRHGFVLESVTPFDMFPQTEHIELVAKLRFASPQKRNPIPAFPARNRAFSRPDKGLRSSRRSQTRS